ncbi:MAG: diguanylate cyclase (GGDEF)-like protein [Cocleimonas sp.]|jgi:diguanylate cyclase (GGDEF)-like protein
MLSRNSLSKSQESEYLSFLKYEKIKLTRIMCMLSSILFAAFIVVDIWALPSAFQNAILIRSMVISCLFLTYFLTYTDIFEKLYSYIVASIYVIATFGVMSMVYIASPTDQAYETYFVGVILILITLFSWTYLKLRVSLPLALIALFTYVYIEVVDRGMLINGREAALVTNVFFLGSAALIGFIAQLMRDRYLRENFLLHKSLKDAYDKKSEEARDNEYLANHDPLTDLPNRRYMMELLNQSLDIASQKGKVLVVMFMDLNGFKQINDVYGHNAGDEVLIIIAKRLELAIRQGDHLSRLGGDEYLMGLMMDKENLGEIEGMANKFVEVISQPMNVEGLRVKVGASIGVAAYPIHGNNIESLISIADHRMYQAKKGKGKGKGKGSVELGDFDFNEQESVVIFPGNKKNKIK